MLVNPYSCEKMSFGGCRAVYQLEDPFFLERGQEEVRGKRHGILFELTLQKNEGNL